MYVQFPNDANHATNHFSPSSSVHQFGYLEVQIQKIHHQIEQAFKKPPTKSNTLPGERLIKQGSRGRRTSLFPSRKAGGLIPVESQLELAHAVGNLERTALNYRSQAIQIGLLDGKCCFPDFVVLTNAGFYEIHEVKPDINHLDDQTVLKLKSVQKILNSAGIKFRIIDSSCIPSAKETEKLLQVYSRGHVQYWTKAQISLGVHLLGSSSILQLVDGYDLLKKNDLPPHLLDFLMFHQLVKLPRINKSIFGMEV